MTRLACALLAIACIATAAAVPPAPAQLPGDSVYHFDARLTDARGLPLAFRGLQGRPRVATMFYANCRYVCPLIVDSVKAIERKLSAAERERIGFVLISMDPERDTPEKLMSVMQERRLDAARWTLLRPEAEDLRGLAGVLGIRYRALADGEFNHSTSLVLLDANGRVLARSGQVGGPTDPEFLAAVRRAATP